MKPNIFFTFLALVFSSLLSAQEKTVPTAATAFFITGADTVFCANIHYGTTNKGQLKWLEYTVTEATSLPYRTIKTGRVVADNTTIRLTGRKQIPDISTFQLKYLSDTVHVFDKVPNKAEEPLGDTRYIERRVDGKLKLYIEHDSYIGYSGSTGTTYAKTNSFCYILRLPDGTFVNVDNKENMKTIIIPYLKQCEAFTQAYKGDYNIGEEGFSAAIRLYNSLCSD